MLFSAFPVSAALTEGSRYSFEEKHLNAYYSTGQWQTADGHIHDNHGQVTLRWIKSTGEPLYCIQIYNGVDASSATATGVKNTNLWKNELTTTAQRGITQISIYGYPNYTYGYTAQDAQLATQVLLWEFEMSRREGYAVKTTSFANQIFTNYPNAEKCYLKIVEACANHQNKPKLSASKVTLKGTGSSNAVTITDSNNVLSNFTVKASNDRIKASISGNKLTVYATGSGKLSGGLIFTKKNTDINSAFALTGANQTLFYGTLSDPVTAMLSVELSLGTLTLHKNSEDGKLEHQFRVTGPNGFDKTVTTNSSGTYIFKDLPEGDYLVQEINTAAYHPHTQPKTAHVKAGANENIYFSNILVKGRIELSKQGEIFSTVTQTETGEYQPVYENTFLPGAEYNVYANEDIVSGTISIAEGTLVDTLVTDSNGSAVTKDLYLNADGTAQYKVVETKAPEGYVLDKEEHIVDLKQTTAGVDVTESLALFDARQKVLVQFDKSLETDTLFNIGNHDEISNVKFGLYAEKEITAADGSVIPEGGLIETMTYDELKEAANNTENSTDEKISAVYSLKTNLPFGEFYIQEIETDAHYILDDTKYPFAFSYTNQDEETVTIQINEGKELMNTLKRGCVNGLKIDTKGKSLEGALIGLFSADATEFTKDTALMTDLSAKDGSFAFSNLTTGEYIVKEIQAPEGYIMSDKAYEISIKDNAETVEIKIVNELEIGRLELDHTYKTSPNTGADDFISAISFFGVSLVTITVMTVIVLKRKRVSNK